MSSSQHHLSHSALMVPPCMLPFQGRTSPGSQSQSKTSVLFTSCLAPESGTEALPIGPTRQKALGLRMDPCQTPSPCLGAACKAATQAIESDTNSPLLRHPNLPTSACAALQPWRLTKIERDRSDEHQHRLQWQPRTSTLLHFPSLFPMVPESGMTRRSPSHQCQTDL